MIEATPPLNRLIEQASKLLRERFDAVPTWVSMAPGRVNLIGEHTDYNRGWVLPIAVDRYTVLAAAPGRVPDTIRVFSAAVGQQATLSVGDTVPGNKPVGHPVEWIRYLEGMVAEYRDRNVICPALDIVAVSSVPLGGGLSSSAALEIAAAHLIEAAAAQVMTSEIRIAAGIGAERHYVGVPCGMMDQTVVERARESHALLLDCADESFTYVPCFGADIATLVIHSGVSHALATGAYAERRAECEMAAATMGLSSLRHAELGQLSVLEDQPLLMARARHVITENHRVHGVAKALMSGDAQGAGVLLSQSHQSLRDDFAVSCEAVDRLVALAQEEEGVLGARMTGGGFGGCVIALVRRAAVGAAAQSIGERYSNYTGRPTHCFTVEAVSGAQEANVPV